MFEINGVSWVIEFVSPDSRELLRSDGSRTVGMTDWNNKTVYLSRALHGPFLRKVIGHELVHCFMFSYDINIPIDEEEFIADWVATYGTDLVILLDELMYAVSKRKRA